jgi:hypothetical protein
MIHRSKLEKLTEEEYGILYYCVNNGTDGEVITAENMVWLKPQYVFIKLNEYAQNLTDDKKRTIQSISDKVVS